MLHATNDDQVFFFSLCFLWFLIFHGHEKTHVNLFFISMDREKEWGIYKMEVVIKKKMSELLGKLVRKEVVIRKEIR